VGGGGGGRGHDWHPAVRYRQANSEAAGATGKPLPVVDEAGPCGYGVYRSRTQKKLTGWVGAPASIPTQAGDRVKTDRRAAGQVARLLRSGDLTPGDVPALAAEALRAVGRARADSLKDGQAATARRTALLRRPDLR